MGKISYNIGNPNLKYLSDLNTIKLLENVKQTKTYIEKEASDNDTYNKDKAYEILEELKAILKKSPNLVFNFFKFATEQNVPLKRTSEEENRTDSIESFIGWLKKNKPTIKQLPKNILQYESFEKLNDDITKTIEEINSKHFWEMVKYLGLDDSRYISENEEKVKDLAISYGKLSKDKRKKYTRKIKYFKVNDVSVVEFLSDLESYLVSGSSREDVNKIIQKYSDEINIEYDKDDVLMVQTEYKPAIKELGSTSWCIQYSDSYFTQYCSYKTFNTQYMVFNFNLPSTNRYSKFGVTVDVDGKPLYGGHQDNDNNPISLKGISEKTGIPIEAFGTKKAQTKEDYQSAREKIQKKIDNIVSIEELLDEILKIDNPDIRNLIAEDLDGSTKTLIKGNKKYENLENCLEEIKKLYKKEIPKEYFKTIVSNILDHIKDSKFVYNYFENFDNIDNDLTLFYNDIFKEYEFFFKPFIDISNPKPEDKLMKSISDSMDKRFADLSYPLILSFRKKLESDGTAYEKFVHIIERLDKLLSVDIEYFRFITSRFNLFDFKYLSNIISKQHISTEDFNSVRKRYKKLFNEIESGKILESNETGSIDYQSLHTLVITFIEPSEQANFLSSYKSADPKIFVKDIKSLYSYYNSVGDEYFKKREDDVKEILKNIGTKNILKDSDGNVHSILEIEKNKVLKWCKDTLIPMFSHRAFLIYYLNEVLHRESKNDIVLRNLRDLKEYNLDFIKDSLEILTNNLINLNLDYDLFKGLVEIYSFDKHSVKEICSEFLEIPTRVYSEMKIDFENYKKVINYCESIDMKLDHDTSMVISEHMIDKYSERNGFSEYVSNFINKNLEVDDLDWDDIIGDVGSYESLLGIYELTKRLDDVVKHEFLSSVEFLESNMTHEAYANIIDEVYDSELQCFIYQVDEFSDLNNMYKGDPFNDDVEPFYYDTDAFRWDQQYSGYDNLYIDTIMTIANIISKEGDELSGYRDLLESYKRGIKKLMLSMIILKNPNLLKEFFNKFESENEDEYEKMKNSISQILSDETYDVCEDIKDSIERGISSAQADADSSEYFNKTLDNLPFFFH
jgi:hypothetical protein